MYFPGWNNLMNETWGEPVEQRKAHDYTARLTSLWGSPPLFWSRRHSIPFSCPSGRYLRPTAQAHAGKRRLADDSVSWPSPAEDREKTVRRTDKNQRDSEGHHLSAWVQAATNKYINKCLISTKWKKTEYNVQFLWNFMKRNKNRRH